MARRIRWQLLIAAISSVLVLGLMGYLALTKAATARPLEGGTYIEGLPAPPQQLNPLVSDASIDPSAADIQALIFEGLVRIGADGLPEPALAQRWELDETGKVYTFTLRTDVKWHDGQPLTIDDVLFTFREGVQNRGFAGDASIATAWRNVLIDQVGEHSIRCTLSAPFAPFLTTATFPILPAHLLRPVPREQWPVAPFNQKPIGTGPYQLAELTAEHALLKINPLYYGRKPFVEQIDLRFFTSQSAAHAALLRGEIMGLGFVSTSEPGLVNPPPGFVRHTIPLDSYSILTFNLRAAPLDTVGLRRALAVGLNKDELISRVFNGQVVRLDTPILPGWWAAANNIEWPDFNQEHARALLDSLGYTLQSDGSRIKDGQTLQFTLLTDFDRLAVAREIGRQWGAIGIRVQVEQLDSPILRQRLADHDFTMALHGWGRLGADPDVFELWHSSQAALDLNYAGLQDKQIDELLEEARRYPDLRSRLLSYHEFQKRWVELVPSIPLYQPLFLYVTSADLGGLGLDPASDAPDDLASSQLLTGREGRFRDVQRWFIRSSRMIHGDLRQIP